jgi:precorrin-2 dehydrogenase/sirohydrochlorin ferrochelatase
MDTSDSKVVGLPLVVDLSAKLVLCVGGGRVASRRVHALVAVGARVTVIAPELHDSLQPLVSSGAIIHQARRYDAGDSRGMFLVVAATNDRSVNQAIAAEIGESNGLVCVASDARIGNCSFMSTIHRGALTIGIQTGGASPAVAAAVRSAIEASLPPNVESALDGLAAMRDELKRRQPDPNERRRLWQAVASSGQISLALSGESPTALQRIRYLLCLSAGD